MTLRLGQKKLFFRSLSTLQNSGVPFLECLESVAAQSEEPQFSESAQRLSKSLLSGLRLSQAMEAQGSSFSRLEVALVRVAENSGTLHTVLARLAEMAENRDRARRELIGALIYPAFVMILCTGLLVLAPVFVFADFLDVLKELGSELPVTTKLYIWFSDLILSPWFYLLAGSCLGLSFFVVRQVGRDRTKRQALESFLLALPGLGPVLKNAAVADASEALAICYQAGVPILSGLQLCAKASFSVVLEDRFLSARSRLSEGEPLAQALAETEFFDPLSVALLATADETGRVSEFLLSVSQILRGRGKETLDTFHKLLEPFLIAFMGLLVGFMAVAILAPTLTLVRTL